MNILKEKFASKAQQRYLYATDPETAEKLGDKMTKKDYEELPDKVKEAMAQNTKTPAYKKADKLLTYLAKYYGLKLKDPRQAASDISRFL